LDFWIRGKGGIEAHGSNFCLYQFSVEVSNALNYKEQNGMPATKAKVKRRRKHCPTCEEEVSMSVVREAENESDLWWLLCPTCDGKFVFTYKEYRGTKRPGMPAIEKDKAAIYHTNKTYSIGDLLYHPKLEDMGLVVGKASSPIADCSGTIIVSFIEGGQKTLIEGYAAG
jgi:hypothetical protein